MGALPVFSRVGMGHTDEAVQDPNVGFIQATG